MAPTMSMIILRLHTCRVAFSEVVGMAGGLVAIVELEGWHTDIAVLELIHTNYISKLQPAASP